MAPSRRAQRQEVYVPQGIVTVNEILPKMREIDMGRLLYLRKLGQLERIFDLQTESVDKNTHIMTNQGSAESPEVIRISVSASFDELGDAQGKINEFHDVDWGDREDNKSEIGSNRGEEVPDESFRGMSVKEKVQVLQRRASNTGIKPENIRNSVALPGYFVVDKESSSYFDEAKPEEEEEVGHRVNIAEINPIRVKSKYLAEEVVQKLAERRASAAAISVSSDEDKLATEETSSIGSSVLAENAKLYQERLKNRTNLSQREGLGAKEKSSNAVATPEEGDGEGAKKPKTAALAKQKLSAARLQTMRSMKSFKRNGSAVTGAPESQINAVFTYEQLKNRSEVELESNPYPDGVDEQNREQYLTDDEFFKVFGMTKPDFNNIAKWRRQELKKRHQLFYAT